MILIQHLNIPGVRTRPPLAMEALGGTGNPKVEYN